jgi:hypothetical protein
MVVYSLMVDYREVLLYKLIVLKCVYVNVNYCIGLSNYSNFVIIQILNKLLTG